MVESGTSFLQRDDIKLLQGIKRKDTHVKPRIEGDLEFDADGIYQGIKRDEEEDEEIITDELLPEENIPIDGDVIGDNEEDNKDLDDDEEENIKACPYCGEKLNSNWESCVSCRPRWLKDLYIQLRMKLPLNQEFSAKEISNEIGITTTTIYHILEELEKQGYIGILKNGRSKTYVLYDKTVGVEFKPITKTENDEDPYKCPNCGTKKHKNWDLCTHCKEKEYKKIFEERVKPLFKTKKEIKGKDIDDVCKDMKKHKLQLFKDHLRDKKWLNIRKEWKYNYYTLPGKTKKSTSHVETKKPEKTKGKPVTHDSKLEEARKVKEDCDKLEEPLVNNAVIKELYDDGSVIVRDDTNKHLRRLLIDDMQEANKLDYPIGTHLHLLLKIEELEGESK